MFDAPRAKLAKIYDDVVDRIRRHRILGEVYELVDGSLGDFARDHGPMYAGALAFYSILSLIPLLVLIASISGFALAGGGEQATDKALNDVMIEVRHFIPYIEPKLEENLRGIIAHRQGLGVFGFGALLLSSSEVFRAIEFALARIFARSEHAVPTDEKAQPRSYLLSKLVFSACVTAAVIALIGLRLFAGIIRHVANAMHFELLARIVTDPLGNGVASTLATGVGIVVGFVILLKIFTQQKVHARFAFIGGALFYLLFQAAHVIYDQYIERITNIGAMYGSFATLIIIFLWIYYLSTLLLVCCHVTKTVQRRLIHGPRWPKDNSSTR